MTKRQYKLPPDLVLKQKFFLESVFYNKKKLCPSSLKWHLETFVALMEAELHQLMCLVVFNGFRALTGTCALMNTRKLQNPPKIALYGTTVIASPPGGIQRFPSRHF